MSEGYDECLEAVPKENRFLLKPLLVVGFTIKDDQRSMVFFVGQDVDGTEHCCWLREEVVAALYASHLSGCACIPEPSSELYKLPVTWRMDYPDSAETEDSDAMSGSLLEALKKATDISRYHRLRFLRAMTIRVGETADDSLRFTTLFYLDGEANGAMLFNPAVMQLIWKAMTADLVFSEPTSRFHQIVGEFTGDGTSRGP
jgi:hypothetical protein